MLGHPSISDALARALPGRFLVFDGPDGSGKSTQLDRFVDAVARTGPNEPAHADGGVGPGMGSGSGPVEVERVREPGGTWVGEEVREILLHKKDSGGAFGEANILVETEMLLFMASRAELCRRRIAPALAAGRLVVSDRFVSSTLAYQGSAGGLGREAIMAVAQVACGEPGPAGTAPGGRAEGSCWPDLTLIFDVPAEIAALRLHGSSKAFDQVGLFGDNMESRGRGFFDLVRAGYAEQARLEPERCVIIDASRAEDEVAADVVRILEERLVACSAARRG